MVGICPSSSLTRAIPKTSATPLFLQAPHHTDAGLTFQQLSVVFRGQQHSLGPRLSMVSPLPPSPAFSPNTNFTPTP